MIFIYKGYKKCEHLKFMQCIFNSYRLLNMEGRSIIDKDLPQCCLLCPDGKIDEIIVPFHCALK